MIDPQILSILFIFHCQLSMSFTSGTQSLCTGQVVDSKQILTARHCIENGADHAPLLIAECGTGGNQRYFLETLKIGLDEWNRAPGTDHILVPISPESPVPALPTGASRQPPRATHPALYFEVDGSLKRGTWCGVLNRENRWIEFGWLDRTSVVPLRYERSTKTITSETSAPHQLLYPGDSGSPLYCKSPMYPWLELVGVTSKLLTIADHPEEKIGNRFTVFFTQ